MAQGAGEVWLGVAASAGLSDARLCARPVLDAGIRAGRCQAPPSCLPQGHRQQADSEHSFVMWCQG